MIMVNLDEPLIFTYPPARKQNLMRNSLSRSFKVMHFAIIAYGEPVNSSHGQLVTPIFL